MKRFFGLFSFHPRIKYVQGMNGTIFKIVFAILCLTAILGIVWMFSGIGADFGDFLNNLWGPAYLLTHGQSPYNIKILFTDKNAVWLPMIIGFAFPLGWLPRDLAIKLWLSLSLIVILWIIWIANGKEKPSPLSFAVVLFATLLFPPMVSHLVLGQFSIFVVALFLLSIRRMDKSGSWLLFFLFALALSKPQLCILALPGFLVAYGKNKGLQTMSGMLLGIVMGVIILVLPLYIGYPNWIKDFLANLMGYVNWLQPTFFCLFRLWWGTSGLIAWGIVACISFGINFWLWHSLPVEDALAWSLALTVIVTPFAWSWDFVLFIPLLAMSIYRLKSYLETAVLAMGYIICWIIMLYTKLCGIGRDEQSWWVPCFLIAVFLVCWIINRRTKGKIMMFKKYLGPLNQ